MATALKDNSQIQKLNADEVRLLWYADFWDGPINGLCLYKNKEHWFELLADDNEELPDSDSRNFLVIELSPEQVADELHWHELFRQKVGTHCDFAEPRSEVKSKEVQREFYEAYEQRQKPDYSINPVVGWFVMG